MTDIALVRTKQKFPWQGPLAILGMTILTSLYLFVLKSIPKEYFRVPAPSVTPISLPAQPNTATPTLAILAVHTSNESTDSAVTGEQVLVERIVDGDTIVVSGNRKVRLIGIDAPEMETASTQIECFATEATSFIETLLTGSTITMVKDVSETDRYKRLLRYIYKDGVMVNDQLVKNGYAHASSYPPDVAHQKEFKASEIQARENKIGLWADGVCTE